MQKADLARGVGWLAAAGAGAGLALGGAAVTGNLGGSTTVERTASASPSVTQQPVSAGGTGALSVQRIYELDAPGVVQLTDAGTRNVTPPLSGKTLGSGFVIDKAGHIVTSNIVLGAASKVRVRFSGTDELNAVVVGKDPDTDVALLQVEAHSRSLSPLPLGNSDSVEVGDPVVAIGNDLDLDRTATTGIVSAVQRAVDAPNRTTSAHGIETDATIDSGNSGGPLINTHGQVIGVNAQMTGHGVGVPAPVGIGFAIPIDIVKSDVAQLIDTGKVEHPYLGLTALPVTADLARAFSLPSSSGLLVQQVTTGSAAARANLRAGHTAVVFAGESYRLGGDIIVAANGDPVSSESELRNVLAQLKPGDELSLTVWQGGKRATVEVKLGQPPG